MRKASIALVTAFGLIVASSAFGQKDRDDKPGHGRGGPPERAVTAPSQPTAQINIVISEHDRNIVYGYYRTEYAAGNCPPGLAKKNNGCLPPGLAKKQWQMGRPLAGDVVYYPLPPALLGQLSPAPAGYQYVRVANDVLMMAVGTRLIAGALADLGGL